ncbi:hypothetical protein GCM10022420_030940 [Streptomyces iranensis]
MIRPATSANSASIPSISGEWNACETLSRLLLTPTAPATASTANSSPEMTVAAGPLTAATLTRSS